MRQEFWLQLYQAMEKDENIWCLVGDLGFLGADKIRDDFPDRFLNCGASEQGMLDIACGLALEGKIPFCYTITPFFYRSYETLRTYIDHEEIPVRLVGSGRDDDYKHDGYSHDAKDVTWVFGGLTKIIKHFPKDEEEMTLRFQQMLEVNKPAFLSLKRGG